MQKDEAERLRIGIRGGWLDVSDAVSWADNHIAKTPHPHSSLLDVALGSSTTRAQMVDLLHAVPGSPDLITVMRACLGDLLRVVEQKPALARDAARWIEVSAHQGDLPAEEFGWEPFALDDDFALAEQGIGKAEESLERLLRFLREHGRVA
jgi:hypothetical protein